MMNEAVSTIMTSSPITVSPSDSLQQVKEIFSKFKIHHIPVCEGSKLVGILTTYDLWKLDIAFESYPDHAVQSVMTNNIAVISPEDKVGTAAELFLDNRFHALPVVDEERNLLGIVTSFDVLKYEFIKEYPNPILYKEVFTRAPQMRAIA